MRRPSPALVIAILALVGAWGGPAAARVLIGTKDVRDRSLRGRDLASNTITGRNVQGLSGRDIARDSLDGSDLDESSLDPVPDAVQARRAESAESLAGVRIRRLDFRADLETVLYDEGGVKIVARCEAGNLVAFAESTAPAGLARLEVRATQQQRYTPDDDFATGDRLDLLPGDSNSAQGTLTVAAAAGDVTTAQYLATDGDKCVLAGTAVHALAG